jgi:phage terminase large subunit
MHITLDNFRPHQLEVIHSLQRFNVLLAHRRFGKTVLAIATLIFKALECDRPRPQVHYFCPTYAQAKRVAWGYVREMGSQIPGVQFNEAELKATLPNGAIIQLGSADSPDASRGLFSDWVVLDEPAQMPPDMWYKVLRPALSDRKGGCLMIGTPAGRHGLFYDCYEYAPKDAEWWRGEYKASQTGIVDHAELVSARANMSYEEYQQEFECSWDASIKGAYYARQMQEADLAGRIATVAPDASQLVHISLDLGISDATAAWFFQLDGNRIKLIEYAEYTNMGLPAIVDDWRKRGHLYGKVIVPHDVNVRSLSTGKTRLETLGTLGVDCIVAPSMAVMDGIEMARTTIPRCSFDKDGCRDGIEALRQYRADWQEKKGVMALRPLHDWSSHGADSFRYLATADLHDLAGGWSGDQFNPQRIVRSSGYSRGTASW